MLVSISICSLGAQYASAAQTDWMNERVEYLAETFSTDSYDYPSDYPSMGELKEVPVRWGNQVQMREAYEVQTASVRLAYAPQIDQWFAAFDHDTDYKYISGGKMVWLAFWAVDEGRKTVIKYKEGWGDGYQVAIVDNVEPYLKQMFDGTSTYYEPQVGNLPYWLQYRDHAGQEYSAYVYSMTFSKNMRYGVFWLGWKQFVRVDFADKNNEAVGFINRGGSWYGGIHNSRASAITNDGKYVFMDDGYSVVSINAACGVTVTLERYHSVGVEYDYPPCQERRLDPTPVTGYDGHHTGFVLADDERSFTYTLSPYPYTSGSNLYPVKKVTVRLYDKPGLKYLALGDSYSSGEGDIGRKEHGTKYYLPLTDIGGDTCHISSRSYPFLLRDAWGMSGTEMQSVACSGARVVPDYYGSLSGYLGQENRLRKSGDILAAREEALEKFTPGHVPQLEFVKRYKPEIVTLTGGGNDVGFANILLYCASSLETCGHVKYEHGAMYENLMGQIDDQYGYTVRLLQKIKEASHYTTTYVVGYPKFVSDNYMLCSLNAAFLNRSERQMINDSVERLNSVLASAAKDGGAKYIDVEDALRGGRLCEGSEYVTGVQDAIWSSGDPKNPNVFHPNHKGHERMSRAILNSKAMVDTGQVYAIKDRPPVNRTHKVVRQDMTDSTMEYGSDVTLTAAPLTFMTGIMINISGLSEPTEIADVEVDSMGGFTWKGKLPLSLKPGYHLLIASGVDPSGQPAQVHQFITITKPGGGNDVCDFMSGWYDEQNGKRCGDDGSQDDIDETFMGNQGTLVGRPSLSYFRKNPVFSAKSLEQSNNWTSQFSINASQRELQDTPAVSGELNPQLDRGFTDKDESMNLPASIFVVAGMIALMAAIVIGLRQRS